MEPTNNFQNAANKIRESFYSENEFGQNVKQVFVLLFNLLQFYP